jgi:hypothetical protein
MRRRVATLISIAFLAYGLIRLGVGSALLGQEIGLFDIEAFRGPVHDVGEFLARSSDEQLIPVSVAGYVSYIALMGVVLLTGALRSLMNRPFGLTFIGAFLVMYALLFVNFQTINPKAVHLAICAGLFGILLWLNGSPGRKA